jgi:hypothetical protein
MYTEGTGCNLRGNQAKLLLFKIYLNFKTLFGGFLINIAHDRNIAK